MDAQQTEQAINALPSPYNAPKEDRATVRARYVTAQAEIHASFAEYLAEQYLQGNYNKAQKDVVFQQAWEDGHAHGYREVENHYQTLSDFLYSLDTLATK